MKYETTEQIPKSLELARIMEQTEDMAEIKRSLGEFLKSVEADLGVELTDNPGMIYEAMKRENCLARVETLTRVLSTLELNTPLEISDEDETHYANAVIPTEQGIGIAFSEGQAPGPIRTMVGFGKTIIGFKTDNLSVEEISFNPDDPRGAAERKYLCRHVHGSLLPDDIRSIVMRIPRNIIDEELLTEAERSTKSTFIFRALLTHPEQEPVPESQEIS